MNARHHRRPQESVYRPIRVIEKSAPTGKFMRYSKTITAVAAGLVVALGFYGCGGSDDAPATPASPSSPSQPTTPTNPATPADPAKPAEATGRWTTGDLH